MSIPAPEPHDIDPQETREWLESLDGVLDLAGAERARFLISCLQDRARGRGVALTGPVTTDFVNTIAPPDEPRGGP